MPLNIDKTENITSDVYGINSYVNEIKRKYNPDVDEDTLMLGIFGYTGEIFSNILQNTVVMASEFSNESIPSKAKFEKNIIAHALGLGITDINAEPAQLDVLLTFIEDDIINWAKAKNANGDELPWEFIFDKDTEIYIGDYCFHTDYDILIRKVKLENSGEDDKFAYTAKYLIDIDNPISDITNPYLTSPVRMRVNGMNIIFMKCTLHQVKKHTIHKKVLSDNTIASKTLTFTFEGQLASFTIDVTEGNKTTHMIPVYEGLVVDTQKYPHFYYTYLDSNTIRIKFDRMSYQPRMNSDVKINIQITAGEAGNFTFDPEVYPGFACESNKYGYSNIGLEIRPITGESDYGTDKKSIEDLKKLIPKEALSRGSITNLADLENYFNMLNTDDSKLYFYKKRDNALERLYYSYILIRDKYNVIIPTNTIDIKVDPDQLQTEAGSGKLIFKKGQIIKLSDANDYGELYTPSEGEEPDYSQNFMYVIPYSSIISLDPLYGMYCLSVIDAKKFLDFSYINEECLYQYIATSISWHRGYSIDPNSYDMTIRVEQNINDDENQAIIERDENGNIEVVNIKCVAVFYNSEGEPYRWSNGELLEYEENSNIFSFRFNFTTEDYIDSTNKIRIDTGMLDIGTENESYGHFDANTKCVIHILSKQGASYGLNKLDKIIPGLDGYTLSNSYTVVGGIDFFYDYSSIISSTILTEMDEEDGKEYFKIRNVPVVKYDYFDNEDKVLDFCNELVKRKNYIDYAVQILEDAFEMNFKFFNTYGPSKLFTLDNELEYINRTNLGLTFRLRLNPNYDTNIINDIINDIKKYIEDINEINSLHMPNLVTDITTKYRDSLVYFEFVDMNGYGPSIQHIYSMKMPDEVVTPEFLNISTLPDGTPDINIIMA